MSGWGLSGMAGCIWRCEEFGGRVRIRAELPLPTRDSAERRPVALLGEIPYASGNDWNSGTTSRGGTVAAVFGGGAVGEYLDVCRAAGRGEVFFGGGAGEDGVV